MMSDFVANSDLEPELRSCHDEIKNINRAAEDLVRNLTEAQLLWKPEPHVWSIAQCLDHMVATARAELPAIRRTIAEGRSRQGFGHGLYHDGLLGWLLIKVMGERVRVKFKSPGVYLPSDDKAPADVIREFFLVQEEWLECVREANGLDLARTKVPIFYCKYTRLSLRQEFKLFVVHEQRHILQAQRIKNALR
jgi:hypothetical protein